MKKFLALYLLAAALVPVAAAQDETKVLVPKDMLTKEQLAKIEGHGSPAEVHQWVGVGKEIGEAVNASLQAVTTQANNFAQTGVGKLTVVLVVWKVLGDQIVHLVGGLLELVVFLPLWLWSYRKTCITRAIKMPDKTVKLFEYNKNDYGDCTPRTIHALAIVVLVGTFLATVFSY